MKKNISKTKFPTSVKVKLSNVFKDHRGYILNISNELFRSCALIKSKKDSIRANHYHKKDWHYCYVLKGKIEYYWDGDDISEFRKIKLFIWNNKILRKLNILDLVLDGNTVTINGQNWQVNRLMDKIKKFLKKDYND